MAREINKLTARTVMALHERGYYGDGAGLYLQIGPTGGKSWLFRYMIDGKAYNMGLGPVHTISLAEARTRAKEARNLLLEGKNPREERDAALAARKAVQRKTFREATADCIEALRPGWKNAKHADQWGNTLETYAFPFIGDLDVAKIGVQDVLRCLTPIWATKTETASRVRMRIEAVLNHCKELRGNTANPAEWKGNLETKLARPTKAKKVAPRAALPFARMHDFLIALRKQEGIGARALEFQIYCASRPGEVRWATWDEFDLDAAMWHIPAERMKADKAHDVPLSEEALALLKALPRFVGSNLVFTTDGRKPISENTANEAIKRLNGDDPVWVDPRNKNAPVVAHGFRSTFRDWAGETTSFPRETIEHALAHQLKDAAEAAYARGTQLQKRRTLMQAWATYCNTALKKGKVVAMHAEVGA